MLSSELTATANIIDGMRLSTWSEQMNNIHSSCLFVDDDADFILRFTGTCHRNCYKIHTFLRLEFFPSLETKIGLNGKQNSELISVLIPIKISNEIKLWRNPVWKVVPISSRTDLSLASSFWRYPHHHHLCNQRPSNDVENQWGNFLWVGRSVSQWKIFFFLAVGVFIRDPFSSDLGICDTICLRRRRPKVGGWRERKELSRSNRSTTHS